MAKFSGSDTAGKVKGWLGVVLSFLPVLYVVPVPAVQAIAQEINALLIGIFGAVGVGLQASAPAVAGKRAKE